MGLMHTDLRKPPHALVVSAVVLLVLSASLIFMFVAGVENRLLTTLNATLVGVSLFWFISTLRSRRRAD
jgi:uncharacterized membrane protein